MTLLVLIDLDDTLLENNIDTFLPVYLKLLSQSVDSVPSELFVNQLLLATRKMVKKSTPEKTLETVFDEAFYPAIGVLKEEINDVIENFYATTFSSLQSLTKTIPHAATLVKAVLNRGHSLVIATNPVFPRMAVLQRLKWAGIPADHTPYHLITTFENFHFTKPHPAYYAEVIAQMGCPKMPVVMIGNSLTEDILPASQLGLPTFWVTDQQPSDMIKSNPFTSSGSLNDVLPWLEKIEQTIIYEEVFHLLPAISALLKSTPASLETTGKRLAPQDWAHKPLPGEWNTIEIICHLRDVDQDIFLPRLITILNENNPSFSSVAIENWSGEREYSKQDGNHVMQEFMLARGELLRILDTLSQQDMDRPFCHPALGQISLGYMLNSIIKHDRAHIRQVFDAITRTSQTP